MRSDVAGTLALLILVGLTGACDNSTKRRSNFAFARDSVLASHLLSDLDSAQTVLVYIGASDCAFATSAAAQADLQQTITHFKRMAQASGSRVITVGISIDSKRALGLAHLRTITKFDYEFPLGASENPGMKFFAGDSLGLPETTPQVALLKLIDVVSKTGLKASAKLVYRAEGEKELARWAKMGWSMPR